MSGRHPGDQGPERRRDRGTCKRAAGLAVLLLLAIGTPLMGAGSITDNSMELPGSREIWQVMTLRDYNTRVVVLGTASLGLAAGMIGTFMLLRKRALLGDALSHATLPGIAIAFILMALHGGDGKHLGGLLLGAAATGLLGVGCILLIRHFTRLKEDAALGIVLSVFFGLGVALLGVIQKMGTGSAAGLESFIYGKTASMLASDARIIGATALVVAVACALLFKEFTLLCFDPAYARTGGWPVVLLDLTLMTFVTAVTVIGLQAVGLILIIAMLIIPPAAARFWTERLLWMLVLSALIGALSGMIGAAASALVPRMPAGAIIVVTASLLFTFSLLFGTSRGALRRWSQRRELNRKIERQNLLRAVYELTEDGLRGDVSTASLMGKRAWTPRELARLMRLAVREGSAVDLPGGMLRLTEDGADEARRLVRNHRLWEMYLITHADVAASHVDRDADAIEHVLGREMVSKLERALEEKQQSAVPRSPHTIGE